LVQRWRCEHAFSRCPLRRHTSSMNRWPPVNVLSIALPAVKRIKCRRPRVSVTATCCEHTDATLLYFTPVKARLHRRNRTSPYVFRKFIQLSGPRFSSLVRFLFRSAVWPSLPLGSVGIRCALPVLCICHVIT